jgi:DNA-binding LacI/PurR family transcriptional regulator
MLPTGAIGGLLLVGASEEHPLVTAAAAADIPIRCIGRPPGSMPLPFVDVDNSDGAGQAAEHLLLCGRRRVAVIAGPAKLPAAADRLSGFTQVINDAGVDLLPVAHGDFTYASGVHAMRWLLERVPDVDAVFACADTMAAGAVHTLRATGRTVPGDVAMIGFDDAPFARYMTPPLTTVRQPIEELTIQAIVGLLDDMADRVQTKMRLLPTELVVRESA